MASVIYTRLSTHKEKPRIWLEGGKLKREGVESGTTLYVRFDKSGKRIVMSRDSKGYDRIANVSFRSRNGQTLPVIDLRDDTLAEVFANDEDLKVSLHQGRILIVRHIRHEKIEERETRLKETLAKGEPLKVASLFHGGGVLDLSVHKGLARAGVNSYVKVVSERESDYLESSLKNNGCLWRDDSLVLEGPVQMMNFDTRSAPQVDLLLAGIPCTGASVAGRAKNKLKCAEEHDDAGALFYYFLRAVEAMNPSVVVIENVPTYQNSASMYVIRSVLQQCGYTLTERVMSGNQFGTLEDRQRLCVVATSVGLETDFSLDNVLPLYKKEESLAEILEDVPADSPRWKSFSYLADKEARDIAAGKGFKRQLLTPEADKCGTIGRSYAKCRSTEPFVVADHDSSLSRLFTPVEHARVKKIPESVIADLPETTAHEILGQSVLMPVFEAVAFTLGQELKRLRRPTQAAANSEKRPQLLAA